ncbi:hypothetical protein KUCAC02_035114, partial [Chaenocephalus aceratus]
AVKWNISTCQNEKVSKKLFSYFSEAQLFPFPSLSVRANHRRRPITDDGQSHETTRDYQIFIYASVFDQWEDGIELRKVRDIQSDDLSDVLWGDQDEEQDQKVFKRFLFHYSQARNSIGAMQQPALSRADSKQVSHSVHPLMRLFPKLSQRRKKNMVLL